MDKARLHLLTFRHRSSIDGFFGKTGLLVSRFAGGPCFGVRQLQAAFSASFYFFPISCTRTLSKSVLVGWETFRESQLRSTTALLRP